MISFPTSAFSSKVRSPCQVLKVADVRIQGNQALDHPVLGARGHVVFLHGQNQVLRQGIELGISDGHVRVQFPHFAAGVGAGAAAKLT